MVVITGTGFYSFYLLNCCTVFSTNLLLQPSCYPYVAHNNPAFIFLRICHSESFKYQIAEEPMSYVPDQPISILIVDDEKEACKNLRNLITDYVTIPVQIAGIAHTTAEAATLIAAESPDAVFLDINMPGDNVFEFLEQLSPLTFEIVFVTAYDEYAVKAFRLNAVDYLLKPIDIRELINAVQKLAEKLHFKKGAISGMIPPPTFLAPGRNGKIQQITLKDNNCIEVVDLKNVIYIAANGSYSNVFFIRGDQVKEVIMSNSIADYEELLPPTLLYRIHKSYLVNCMHVKQIIRKDNLAVNIHDKFQLPIGRRRYTGLMTFLQHNNFQDV